MSSPLSSLMYFYSIKHVSLGMDQAYLKVTWVDEAYHPFFHHVYGVSENCYKVCEMHIPSIPR